MNSYPERRILLHGQESAVRFSIFARWFTSVLAFLIAFLSLGVGVAGEKFAWLFSFLLVALAANAIIFVRERGMQRERIEEGSLRRIAVASATIDLVYVFGLLLLTGSGVASALYLFLVVPIVIAMLSLGSRGSVAVAVSASILLFAATFFSLPNFSELLLGLTSLHIFLEDSLARSLLLEALLVSALFILLGQFSAAIADFFTSRELEAEQAYRKEEALAGELAAANDQLRSLDELKSQMISIAAHQLRTPLSGMKWMLGMLYKGDVGELSEPQSRLVKEGIESNEKLITLVNDMLTLDRLESGRLAYEFAEADLVALVNNVVNSLTQRANEKKLRIDVYSDYESLHLSVDRERMRDALTNLIDNAIKYSKPGGSVSVMILKMEGGVHIAIHDKGIGIPEAEQTRLFSRFFRASNAVHEQTEGTGLGLTIARNVAIRHGGDIKFDSKYGEGSTFILMLPTSEGSVMERVI